ncbi:DUF418 domain-containing protein [Nonomuraea sp. NPDC050790]|uniref:DUF418 domain-containing protein n=1 Tax=Nonomuraea sp. NPDC050790 TaxID=3364371 RepID=UPI00379FE71B
MLVQPTAIRGGTKRSLAPDLARGLMLLLIALAHAPVFVANPNLGPQALNTVSRFLTVFVADNLARSMFVFLFGYGLGQLARSRLAAGAEWPSVRKLLRRRGFWLLVIGFLHATLLVPIDIISTYGLALLITAAMVRARDSVLLWTAAISSVPATGVIAWQTVRAHAAAAAGNPETLPSLMKDDFLSQVLIHLMLWPAKVPATVLLVLPGIAIGIWAARRRILDNPEQHVALLRRVTISFLGLAVVGRLPMALIAIGAWKTDATWVPAIAHTLTGFACGIGLAAAVGLIAIKINARIGREAVLGSDESGRAAEGGWGRVTTALVALGRRSLTFYLFQSVVFVALFYPFTLNLAGTMGAAAAHAIGIGTWLLSIVLADWMRRVGHRGPFELVLRRLSR